MPCCRRCLRSAHLPRYECSAAELENIRHGRAIRAPEPGNYVAAPAVALVGPDETLVAMAIPHGDMLAPKNVFSR